MFLSHRRHGRAAAAVALILPFLAAAAEAATPAELLARYTAEAGAAASAARGQAFFTSRQGRDWSCSSCHTANPAQGGEHAASGRKIAPLAPSAHAERFTDPAKVEKWFRRNCNDVAGRACSPQEKADVLAWLVTVK